MTKNLFGLSTVLLPLIFAATASAVPVSGGMCDGGGTVTFTQIQSTANFGNGNCFGDVLDYDPFGFSSSSSPGSDIENGQLNFTIVADQGNFIEELRITEAGDYALAASGAGTANASANLEIFLTIQVTEFGNPALLEQDEQNVTFVLPADTVGQWNLESNLDITQILIDAGIFGTTGRATQVQISINNILTTEAEIPDPPSQSDDASAFIAKKDTKGFTVTVVPEPSTALLMGLGLLALKWQGRTR